MAQGGRSTRLLGWLAVIAALAVVLGALYLAVTGGLGARHGPSLAATSAPPAATRAPIALWDAFEQALLAARAAAPDARLVSASTQWQAPTQGALVAGAVEWSFVFYTPSQQSSVDVAVGAEAARVVKLTRAWVAPRALEEGQWRAGPQDALLVFLAYEGSDFLTQHPGAVVDLNLAQSEAGSAVWTIVALDTEAREYLALTIDSTSGDVLRCEKANPGA